MGRAPRPVPIKLSTKLRAIRLSLDFTQAQMFDRLGETRTRLYVGHIGEYETGVREPPLRVILQYARVAGVPMEALVDDDLDLPKHLPSAPDHEWIMRRVRVKRRV
ncbi:MAG: helix-turn-helix domain-containing protein [Pyrinomonadaceae bacterium MAG19_C2-C3]|nr:helix-turn-helix domain-containing protein [Pyrinomonadaceae bacterium MAG19_C2-C3]